MDAKDFLEKYGREKAEQVAVDAGTKFVYFQQIASGFRKPSPQLTLRLVEASGGRLKKKALRPDVYG